MAEGSLTAAFILSQHDAGVRRLLASRERPIAQYWLNEIACGRASTTVGISQLTTSRRHGPHALRAISTGPDAYQLDGAIPWVTAAGRANVVVAGASLDDGRQLLIALPTDRSGLTIHPPLPLAALQASCTCEAACDGVKVVEEEILAGPVADVIASTSVGGTGGLETSALALGQAHAALRGLVAESPKRADLAEPVDALAASWTETWSALQKAAAGAPDALPSGQIRAQGNALALKVTQAYLTARKGTGFLRTEPRAAMVHARLSFSRLVVSGSRGAGLDSRPGGPLHAVTRPGSRLIADRPGLSPSSGYGARAVAGRRHHQVERLAEPLHVTLRHRASPADGGRRGGRGRKRGKSGPRRSSPRPGPRSESVRLRRP